jgi:hypothetical protein
MEKYSYLETIENEQDLPNGKYFAYWYKYDVLFKYLDAIYNFKVTKYQRSQAVPVTLVVTKKLIDVYLGHIKEK